MGLQLTQQINLLQSEFKTKQKFVSAKNLQNATILFIVVLSMATAYDYSIIWQQNDYYNELQINYRELEKSLQAAKKAAPTMVIDNQLKLKVSELKSELKTKKKVLQALSGQSFGNTNGFSSYFKGLADQNIEGLWLTHLNIRDGGDKIAIQGSAFRPELVPDFIYKLSNEDIFQGTNFHFFRVTREKNPERVNFYIDTVFDESTL